MMDEPARWVYSFDGVHAADPARKDLLGGKGASLAAMTRAGLPVPPGFTIVTTACERFFRGGETWPAGLEEQVRAELSRLEETTDRRFGRGPHPLLVSVRSGAAASMPGMMDTLLNCGMHPALAAEVGDTPAFWRVYLQFIRHFVKTVAGLPPEALAAVDAAPSRETAERCLKLYAEKVGRAFPTEPWQILTECINAVFRSWNNERAVAYRRQHDLRGLGGTAVNVQAMFPSQVSGVLFTQDPNAPAADRMVIESSYGLGESVVSGEVTPDRFVVERGATALPSRADPAAIQTHIGNKAASVAALGQETHLDPHAASLLPEQVGELVRIGLKIESHFGRPMDIEWGWADGRFALLQCRPIRGLEVARDVEVGRQEEIARLRALAAGKPKVWVAHNLGETLRAPTPLTWDIIRRFMSAGGGFGRMYRDLGYRPARAVPERGFLELIGGRIYADPDRVAGLFWEGMPLAYDLEAVLRDRKLLDSAPTEFDPERADARFLLRLPGIFRTILRSARIAKRARRTVRGRFENEVLPPYLAWVQAKRAEDPAGLSTAALVGELHARQVRVLDEFGGESLKPGFFGGMALEALRGLLTQLAGPAESARLTCALTMGLDGDITVEQNILLCRVARGEATMAQFLERFGHRAAGEMELAEPRWREDASYLERVVKDLAAGDGRAPDRAHAENARRRGETEAALPDLLARWGGSSFREEIEEHLRLAQALLPYRETGKHYLMMGYELLRLPILDLARRWDLGRDIFFLTLDELPRFEQGRRELEGKIADRKVRWQSARLLAMPDVIDSRTLDGLGHAPVFEAARELRGEPVAAGVASGLARVVYNAENAGALGTDYILVCPSTDPGWTPLFINARGLVVERGGVLSHGAIVARDFGLPAVVCPDATRRLRSGELIRVDGNTGTISILETGQAPARSTGQAEALARE